MRKIKLYPVMSPDDGGYKEKLDCYAKTKKAANKRIREIVNNRWSARVSDEIDALEVDGQIMILGDPIKNHVEIDGVHYDARNVTDDVFGE